MLLEKSPNVNAVDADGMAALAHACKEGHEDVAVKLLKAGAYTNVQVGCGFEVIFNLPPLKWLSALMSKRDSSQTSTWVRLRIVEYAWFSIGVLSG